MNYPQGLLKMLRARAAGCRGLLGAACWFISVCFWGRSLV